MLQVGGRQASRCPTASSSTSIFLRRLTPLIPILPEAQVSESERGRGRVGLLAHASNLTMSSSNQKRNYAAFGGVLFPTNLTTKNHRSSSNWKRKSSTWNWHHPILFLKLNFYHSRNGILYQPHASPLHIYAHQGGCRREERASTTASSYRVPALARSRCLSTHFSTLFFLSHFAKHILPCQYLQNTHRHTHSVPPSRA
jgi:hypothetical protein